MTGTGPGRPIRSSDDLAWLEDIRRWWNNTEDDPLGQGIPLKEWLPIWLAAHPNAEIIIVDHSEPDPDRIVNLTAKQPIPKPQPKPQPSRQPRGKGVPSNTKRAGTSGRLHKSDDQRVKSNTKRGN
jgi:hypothetical protein